MKKVVIISGSSRKGNTKGISNIYANIFSENGCFVNIIDLSSEPVSFCDGCLSCDETKICKNDDIMKEHISCILNSDLIVLGTPARWALLSGEIKTFIDRLNPYASSEGYAGKNVFIFALGQSAEQSSESIDSAINSIVAFTDDAGMELIGRRKFCDLLEVNDYLKNKDIIMQQCIEDVDSILKGLNK